ncbi:MAG: insulinase family protein, partial [Candidatus Eremiobacteraeota bacterium]|nr:insulinase family protein [Candidatus Eremiobacteraeota bacterium]
MNPLRAVREKDSTWSDPSYFGRSPEARTQEFRLDNGLDVVIVPYAAAPVATLMVLYHVGARNEAVGYTGSSHLLEHMLFKGTQTNNRAVGRAFADIMNEIGASKNATTWLDRTNYFETVPVEFLPLAIELEADRMRSALIADADRRSEMTVVRNELERSDNNAARVLSSALVATAFREHPYHHPTIGWRDDVEGVSTERLRELYDMYYHPNNATVFVVGDVAVARTLELIERSFGSLARGSSVIPDVHTSEPPQVGERSLTIKRPGDETLIAYCFHAPAAYGQTGALTAKELAQRVTENGERRDTYALEVLGRILGGGRASRLSRALVDERLALDTSAWNWGSRDPGLFQILVTAVPGVATSEVRRAVDGTLAALAESGPAAAELERAQNQIAVQRAFARDGTFALAQRLGEFEAVGSWHLDDDYVERIAEITIDDVRDAVRTYLHEDNRTVGELVPGTPRTLDRVSFEAVSVRADITSSVPPAPLPSPELASGNRFAGRIARMRFGGGLDAVYVPNGESETVVLRGLIEAGPAFAAAHPLLPALAAQMLARGTRSHDRVAIEERLERAGIRRAYFVDDDPTQNYNALAFRFAAACAAPDMPTLLSTMADELCEPAFEQHEFDLVKSESIGGLRLLRSNTNWRAVQRFLQLVYAPGDVNAEPDLDVLLAEMEALSLADVRAYYESTVLGAPALLSAAGAIDAVTFEALASGALDPAPFASIATPRPAPAVRAQGVRDVRED